MGKSQAEAIFEVWNSGKAELRVICEPWADEYTVRPGSKLILKSDANRRRDGVPSITADFHEFGVSLWFNDADFNPDAELDGVPTAPFNG
jgi:hypothetical protein